MRTELGAECAVKRHCAEKAQEDLVNRKLTHTVASKRVSGRSLEKEGHTNNSTAETKWD